jgi:uncharacterized membrane protein YjjB (DUF3815 family)
MTELVQIITGFFGSLGFGILFNVRGKRLLAASLAGLLSWSLYLLLGIWIADEALRYFIVAFVISVYCEIMARMLKSPTTTFLMTALVALIPGGGLYYTMTNAISGDVIGFIERGLKTISLAVALALGVIVVTVMMNIINKVKKLPKRQ